MFVAADVTRKADCEALVAATRQRFGRLDILVNNAGASVRKRPEALAEDEWRMVLDTNLTSAFLCAQAAYAPMREAGGKIINIGSMMSLFGAPFAAAYAASKGGIVQMTRARDRLGGGKWESTTSIPTCCPPTGLRQRRDPRRRPHTRRLTPDPDQKEPARPAFG